jgi:hypothetical protein
VNIVKASQSRNWGLNKKLTSPVTFLSYITFPRGLLPEQRVVYFVEKTKII